MLIETSTSTSEASACLCVVHKETRRLVTGISKLNTVTMKALFGNSREEHDLSDCFLICYDGSGVASVVDADLNQMRRCF